MAKKQPSPPLIEPRVFQSVGEIESGIAKLERRVQEVKDLDAAAAYLNHTGADQVIEANVRDTIRDVFGASSPEFERYQYISFWSEGYVMGSTNSEMVKSMERGRQKMIGILNGLVNRLKEKQEDFLNTRSTLPSNDESSRTAQKTNDVFVVHGRDEEMKQHVARILSRLGLNPIILHERPNAGRTIIEKFELNAATGFAIVLLSPDDKGCLAEDDPASARLRARQNVILELGYFVGKLGRSRVFPLKRGDDIEVPSDFSGVVYTAFDSAGLWRFELVRELQEAGYQVDANAIV